MYKKVSEEGGGRRRILGDTLMASAIVSLVILVPTMDGLPGFAPRRVRRSRDRGRRTMGQHIKVGGVRLGLNDIHRYAARGCVGGIAVC